QRTGNLKLIMNFLQTVLQRNLFDNQQDNDKDDEKDQHTAPPLSAADIFQRCRYLIQQLGDIFFYIVCTVNAVEGNAVAQDVRRDVADIFWYDKVPSVQGGGKLGGLVQSDGATGGNTQHQHAGLTGLGDDVHNVAGNLL